MNLHVVLICPRSLRLAIEYVIGSQSVQRLVEAPVWPREERMQRCDRLSHVDS